MKKKKIILASIIIAILLIITTICLINININKANESNIQNNTQNELEPETENNQEEQKENIIQNQIEMNETEENKNESVNELKQDLGISGNSNIYEVQQEDDGRQSIVVKANVKYKVAFAGMIKNSKPSMNEIDKIFENNIPKYYGIWVKESSRNKIIEYLNNSEKFNSTYEITDKGYIKIKQKNNQSEYDKKLENVLNRNKQFIIDISSVCYIVDDITGEILDYSFEKMDKYQTYEYFQDSDKIIIFVSENSEKLLKNDDIFDSIFELIFT